MVYPGDWFKDTELAMCGLATRGAWFEWLLRMREQATAKRPPRLHGSVTALSQLARCSPEAALEALIELGSTVAGVVTLSHDVTLGHLKVTDIVTLENRRMTREYRAIAGAAVRKRKQRENEAEDGRCHADVTPALSSSSSDASSDTRNEDRENQNSPSCRTASDDVETSTDTEPHPKAKTAHREPVQIKAVREFEVFWKELPSRVKSGRAKALGQWCRYPAADRPLDRALEWLKAAKASEQWQKDGGQFAPRGGRIVEDKLYLDGVDSFEPAPAPIGGAPAADAYETLIQNGQCVFCERPIEVPGIRVLTLCLGCDVMHNGPKSSEPDPRYEGFETEKAEGQQWVTRVTDASGKVLFG